MYLYKKSQISLEYIFIIGFLLMAMIPIFYYAITQSSSTINLNQADDAVNTIANAADRIYSLGPGSRDYVWVTLPNTMKSSTISQKEIMIIIDNKGQSSEIHTSTIANLSGNLPLTAGTHRIALEMMDNGIVQIGTNITPTCLNQGYICCSSCMPGTGQSTFDSNCVGQVCCGACYAETCNDLVKNQDESDIDCGGTCGANCLDGQTCNTNNDCINLCNITSNLCYSPSAIYYYVDSTEDEIIFIGTGNSGDWQSTNSRDLVYRVIDESEINEESTIFTDDFEDQVVNDAWTVDDGDGNIRTGSYEHSGSYAVEADNFDNCNNPGYMENSFDLTSAVSANFIYWYYPGDIETNEWMKVKVDDGSGYVTYTTHWGTNNGNKNPNPTDYTQYIIDLSSYNLVSGFKIKFEFCGDHRDDNHWLDDISMTKTLQAYRLNMTYIIDDIVTGYPNYQLNISGKGLSEDMNIYVEGNILGTLTSTDSYVTANVASYVTNGYINISIIDTTTASDAVQDSLYMDYITVRAY